MTVNDVLEKNISNFKGWSIRIKFLLNDGYNADIYDLEDFYMSNTKYLDYIVDSFIISFISHTIDICIFK